MIKKQLLLATIAVAVLGSQASTASAEWWGQFPVSVPSLGPSSADVGMTPEGVATVVWVQRDSGVDHIHGARFEPNSTTPIDFGQISPSGGGGFPRDPQVAVNNDGTAIVVWAVGTGSTRRIEASSIEPDSTTPTSFGTISSGFAEHPTISGGQGSTFAAGWTDTSGGNQLVRALRLNASGPVGSVEPLTTTGSAFELHAFTYEDGRSTFVWQRSGQAEAVSLPPTGPPTDPPILLPVSGSIDTGPVIAGENSGYTTVIWSAANGGNGVIEGALVSSDATTAIPIGAISDGTQYASQPAVATNSDGYISVVWTEDGGGHGDIYTSSFYSGQSPGTPFEVSEGTLEHTLPQVAVAQDSGPTTVVWAQHATSGSGDFAVASATVPHRSSIPTSPQIISGNNPNTIVQLPALAGDGRGLVFAAWQQDSPGEGLWANRTYSQGSLTPSTIDFGNVTVGSSATQRVTLTNTDPISPLGVDFPTLVPDTDLGLALADCEFDGNPGQSCGIDITYRPTSAGPLNSTLTVPTNARTPLTPVSITGTGIATPSPTPAPTPTPKPNPCTKVTTRSAKPVRIKPTDHTGDWSAGIRLVASTSGAAKLKVQATGTVNVNGRQRKITFRAVNNMTVSKQRRYGLFPTSSSRRYAQLGKRIRLTLKTTITPLQTGCTASAAASQTLTSTVRKIVTRR